MNSRDVTVEIPYSKSSLEGKQTEFKFNVSSLDRWLEELTSNHNPAPAGSQADTPPFLLWIIINKKDWADCYFMNAMF